MKLFLDTNIILDALIDRSDSHKAARLLLALGYVNEIDLFVSPSQWTDLYYVLSEGDKPSRRKTALNTLRELRKCIHISPLGEDEIDKAMQSGWDDFEDAVVYAAACTIKPEALITENLKNYKRSAMPVYTCEGFFEYLKEAYSTQYAEVEV